MLVKRAYTACDTTDSVLHFDLLQADPDAVFRHGAVCRWQPWRCRALSQSEDGVLLKPWLATWSLGAPPGLVPCVRGFGREPSSLAFAWWFLSDDRIRGLFQSDL